MTDEQREKLKLMGDTRLLIELCLAFSNTDDVYLGSYNRKHIINIFESLNLEQLNDLPFEKT